MWTRPILSKPDGGYPYIKDFITPQLRCRAGFRMQLLQQEMSPAYAALKNMTFAVVQAHFGELISETKVVSIRYWKKQSYASADKYAHYPPSHIRHIFNMQ